MFSTNLKEFAMNEMPKLEIVELGDAKEVTMGQFSFQATEEHPERPERPL